MNKLEFETWLKAAISDSFMDLFYYDRKNCEEMPLSLLNECEKKGFIDKETLIKLFTNHIETEFIEKPSTK